MHESLAMNRKHFIRSFVEANFALSDEAEHFMANAPFREKLYCELHKSLKPEHALILRALMEFEIQDRQNDSIGDLYESLYWCGFLLYRIGDINDVSLLWRAKNTDFDTFLGFDTQFLVGAGVDVTIQYLQEQSDLESLEALKYIYKCQEAGDFDNMDSWFNYRMSYFTGRSQ